MPFKEIKELRQQGKLDEALEMALAEYNADSENVWCKRNLAWIYYDFAKKNCSTEKFDLFYDNLKQISALQLPENDVMITDKLSWQIVKMGHALLRENISNNRKCQLLFDEIKNWGFEKPSESYSALFQLFLKTFKETDHYLSFADWWGFDNFREEDYQKSILPNGKSVMSIVEQAYIAYAKELLPKQDMHGVIHFDRERAKAFLSKLDSIEESHPEYVYPPYFKGKLLIALGDKNNLLSSLLSFVKKKRNDFWAWEMLSEAVLNDQEKVFACYCKGLLCKAQDAMTTKLREKMISLFIERKMWDEAKTEIEHIKRVKTSNQQQIPTIISSYQKEAWYTTAKEKDNNQSVYLQFAPIAEGLLYIDLEEQVIIVDYINFGKKTLYFITLDGQKGFFKYDRFLSNVSVGDVLKTQIIKKDDKGMCHIATLVKSEDAAFNKDFIKDFKGEIKVLKDQNFGFVENVFIIPSLFNKYKLSNKDTVCGKAIKSFNEKKKEWGWKALCISK